MKSLAVGIVCVVGRALIACNKCSAAGSTIEVGYAMSVEKFISEVMFVNFQLHSSTADEKLEQEVI
jgi:hypothetical protein